MLGSGSVRALLRSDRGPDEELEGKDGVEREVNRTVEAGAITFVARECGAGAVHSNVSIILPRWWVVFTDVGKEASAGHV
jgi:hypothetical protein